MESEDDEPLLLAFGELFINRYIGLAGFVLFELIRQDSFEAVMCRVWRERISLF